MENAADGEPDPEGRSGAQPEGKPPPGELRARHVCLAIGRRGVPRKLGVPGEELPKVAYSLLDAKGFQGQRLLVVGGGVHGLFAAYDAAARGMALLPPVNGGDTRQRAAARLRQGVRQREVRLDARQPHRHFQRDNRKNSHSSPAPDRRTRCQSHHLVVGRAKIAA